MPDDKDNPIQTHAPLKHDFGEVVFADSSGEIERPSHVPSTIFKPSETEHKNHTAVALMVIFLALIILTCSTLFFIKQKELKSVQARIDTAQASLEKLKPETQKLSAEVGAYRLAVQAVTERDELRAADMTALAGSLETYYKGPGVSSYPDAALFNKTWITANLKEVDIKKLTAQDGLFIDVPSNKIASSSNTNVPSSWLPQPAKDQYVYEPRNNAGSVCTVGEKCTSFKIWYKTEVDDKLVVIESVNKSTW